MGDVASILKYKNLHSIGHQLAVQKNHDLPINITGKGKAADGSGHSVDISKG